jgi:hypothetical protein
VILRIPCYYSIIVGQLYNPPFPYKIQVVSIFSLLILVQLLMKRDHTCREKMEVIHYIHKYAHTCISVYIYIRIFKAADDDEDEEVGMRMYN